MKQRFIIQQSQTQPNGWVCTDTENCIVCVFEHQKFNETQQFTILEDIKNPDANKLARAVNEMAEWLRSKHYGKAMPTTLDQEHVFNIRKQIGSRVKHFRLQKKLTQLELSEMLCVTEGTISKIEKGKWLSLEMLIKLSISLDFYIFLCEKDDNVI